MAEAVGEKLEAGTIAAVDDNLARGGIDAFERHTRTCRVERRGLGPMHDVEHPLHLVGCLAEDECARDVRLITFDRTSIVEGYQSDITRTFVLGKATDKMKRVFDIVHQAQNAALKAARPGVALDSIDAAARKVVVDNGYGPGYKYFSHRLGHGMGMDGHEWPYLVKNNMFGWEKALTMQPGMVFSDEPGI